MNAPQKRRPGRPRKNPEATQKELARKARQVRLLNQEGEKARHEFARREVQKIVRGVFDEAPWFTKILARLFMNSARRVAEAKLDIEPENLGKFVSDGFANTLVECASFDGLSRAASATIPRGLRVQSAPNAREAAPNLSELAMETLGDFDDDAPDEDLPPLNDDEAAAMGVLPEA